MSKAQLLIEVDLQTQVEVEELCTNQGITLSEYFTRMHAVCKRQIFCNAASSDNMLPPPVDTSYVPSPVHVVNKKSKPSKGAKK